MTRSDDGDLVMECSNSLSLLETPEEEETSPAKGRWLTIRGENSARNHTKASEISALRSAKFE